MANIGFADRPTARQARRLVERFAGKDPALEDLQVDQSTLMAGTLYCELPAELPAKSGTKPGKVPDCPVYYFDDETDDETQLLDEDGDPLLVTLWHYGPAAIPATYDDGSPRRVIATWQMNRIVAIVDYCEA